MSRLTLAGGRQAHHVARHVGRDVNGVGAVGAALAAITSRVSTRIAAKPEAQTPTITGNALARRIICRATATASAWPSLGASPNGPAP
jgi:hypothetical protein